MDYLIFDLCPKEIMKLWSIWSGGRSPSKIYQNQSLINFDEFFEMCWYLPKVGSPDPIADYWMLGDHFPWFMTCRSFYDSLLWQLGLSLGIPVTPLFEWRGRVGLACQMDIRCRFTLHYSELEQTLVALLVFADFSDVLLAQQSTDSVFHGTVPQFNQLIKFNVAMYSTASLHSSTN